MEPFYGTVQFTRGTNLGARSVFIENGADDALGTAVRVEGWRTVRIIVRLGSSSVSENRESMGKGHHDATRSSLTVGHFDMLNTREGKGLDRDRGRRTIQEKSGTKASDREGVGGGGSEVRWRGRGYRGA